jgi:hypothetical protein
MDPQEATRVLTRFVVLYRVDAEVRTDKSGNQAIHVTEKVKRWLPHVYSGLDVHRMEENDVG